MNLNHLGIPLKCSLVARVNFAQICIAILEQDSSVASDADWHYHQSSAPCGETFTTWHSTPRFTMVSHQHSLWITTRVVICHLKENIILGPPNLILGAQAHLWTCIDMRNLIFASILWLGHLINLISRSISVSTSIYFSIRIIFWAADSKG